MLMSSKCEKCFIKVLSSHLKSNTGTHTQISPSPITRNKHTLQFIPPPTADSYDTLIPREPFLPSYFVKREFIFEYLNIYIRIFHGVNASTSLSTPYPYE